MRRRTYGFLRVALGFLTTSLVVQGNSLAQHGASAAPAHMGGNIHSSSSFSGSPRTFAPPAAPLFQSQRPAFHPPGQSGHWPSAAQDRRHYNSHRVGYRGPYFYAGYPGLLSYGYGLGFTGDQDEGGGAQIAPQQADYSNQPAGDYDPQASVVAANTPSPFRPTYQGQTEAAPVHLQPTTTLIFKDGRLPVQVHNYALTASTVYALDGDSRREIPLSLLDVPATIETNRKAGVDFALPVSR